MMAGIVSIIVYMGVVLLIMIFSDALLNEDEIEEDTADPLETLRERYIADKLSEAEFERAVERELADDNDRPLDATSDRGASSDHELEPESWVSPLARSAQCSTLDRFATRSID